MTYPVSITVDAQIAGRNRLTTALRPILVVPHAILVGPIYWSSRTGGVGLLGAAAYVLAIVSWFTLLITGEQLRGIRDFSLYYLRWRTRSLAYMALLTDPYPPFGDGTYPATVAVADPPLPRDRLTIAARLILALPHLFVLFFLTIGWFVATVIAWFAILFTGSYPASLSPFGVSVIVGDSRGGVSLVVEKSAVALGQPAYRAGRDHQRNNRRIRTTAAAGSSCPIVKLEAPVPRIVVSAPALTSSPRPQHGRSPPASTPSVHIPHGGRGAAPRLTSRRTTST
jgi:hypothetical protein